MKCMLTTIDNPFNPFKKFDDWYNFDESKGYHSLSYLARIAKVSVDLPDLEKHMAIETAIDEIVRLNILGIYKKVSDSS